MLYDQRWDAKTRADPFSLESLIAWLEMRPADARYRWGDCKGGCLLSKYLTDCGYPTNPSDAATFPVWRKLHTYFGGIAFGSPQTFGGALTRARAVLTERAGA